MLCGQGTLLAQVATSLAWLYPVVDRGTAVQTQEVRRAAASINDRE